MLETGQIGNVQDHINRKNSLYAGPQPAQFGQMIDPPAIRIEGAFTYLDAQLDSLSRMSRDLEALTDIICGVRPPQPVGAGEPAMTQPNGLAHSIHDRGWRAEIIAKVIAEQLARLSNL